MGDPKTATRRLNLAQAFNPMGALAGLIVAQNYILAALQSDDITESGALIYENLEEAERNAIRTADLAVIRDPYVILGFLVIVFFLVILFTKMPQNESQESKSKIGESIKRLFKNQKFVVGVIAQMFYVGAQIMVWTYLYQYAESFGIENTEAVNYGIAALVVFLIGRWVGTALLKYVDSGKLLLFFAIGAALATLITIMVPGMIGLIALVSISFFMSIMFPTIYGIALEGQGEDAKFGAAFLVMAIVGGALMPTLQGLILDLGGSGYTDISILGVPEVNFSFILPFICFVIIGIYGRDVYKKYNINH